MSEKERPEYLYHYTNFKGLEGILRENCLWATDAHTSNDSSEINHGIKLLQNYLKNEARITEILSIKIDHFIRFLLGESGIGKGVFLSCFSEVNEEDEYCKKNGLLSQWRGYGSEQGYVIKFQSEVLLKNYTTFERESEDVFIGSGSVEYVNDKLFGENRNLLESLEKIKAVILELEKDPHSFNGSGHEKILFQNVLLIALFSKHLGFKEEKEFRVSHVLWDSVGQSEEIFFYEKNGILRSYIKLFKGLVKVAISEIIIGPSPHKEKNRRKIQTMLKQLEIKADAIISETPYV